MRDKDWHEEDPILQGVRRKRRRRLSSQRQLSGH